ncbi:MAG: hypothetical protein KAW47_05370 [Thermoplasmatales archaeon]|nr:hypothetical protein [Thermoplasmatales archaeon]
MNDIKEKNLCGKCKKMTWYEYMGLSGNQKGKTNGLECSNERILWNVWDHTSKLI